MNNIIFTYISLKNSQTLSSKVTAQNHHYMQHTTCNIILSHY